MKHIKKTCFLQVDSEKFEENFFEGSKKVDMGVFNQESLKKLNNSVVFVQTSEGQTIGSLVQKVNGTNYLFPVPDPTLVYFHNAQANLIEAKKVKSELLKKLSLDNIKKEIPIHDLYNYYGFSTSVIINLFTSIGLSLINKFHPITSIKKRPANV